MSAKDDCMASIEGLVSTSKPDELTETRATFVRSYVSMLERRIAGCDCTVEQISRRSDLIEKRASELFKELSALRGRLRELVKTHKEAAAYATHKDLMFDLESALSAGAEKEAAREEERSPGTSNFWEKVIAAVYEPSSRTFTSAQVRKAMTWAYATGFQHPDSESLSVTQIDRKFDDYLRTLEGGRYPRRSRHERSRALPARPKGEETTWGVPHLFRSERAAMIGLLALMCDDCAFPGCVTAYDLANKITTHVIERPDDES